MDGSADTTGMLDVDSCRSEIVHQGQLLELELESTPDLSHSEMRGARGSFFGSRFGHIFSLAFSRLFLVAAFRGPNSDSRNGVCFAASRQASTTIAPEAPSSQRQPVRN